MKKAVIGGFLSLLGTIWGLAVILFVGDNLVSGWTTPPGRFLATVMATGMTFPLLLSAVFLILGIAIMAVEYFRKD